MKKNCMIIAILLVSILWAENPQHGRGAHDKESSEPLDPNHVYMKLLQGNKAFMEERNAFPHIDNGRRIKTAKNGQTPMATILSCSDSRVPAEYIFDMGIGDIFVIRVAGNIAGKSEIGTIEYGVGHLRTPLLIVMGHTKCGAVTATCNGAHVEGSIVAIVNKIKPAVEYTRKQYRNLPEDEFVLRAIKANVFKAMEDILLNSAEVRKLISGGKLKVVGAIYDIETGKVSDIGVHYRQEQILYSKKEKDKSY
jgi:carbonic anhydrase